MPRRRPVAVATAMPRKKWRRSEVVEMAAGADTASTKLFADALAQEDGAAPAALASSQGNILPVWRHEEMPAELPDTRKEMAPEEVYRLMNAIGSKVIKDLPRFFAQSSATHREFATVAYKNAQDLHMHDPLAAQALSSDTASWNGAEAAISLRKLGLYEASANITWLNPFTEDELAQKVSGDPPKWSDIVLLADAFMTMAGDQGKTLAAAQSPGGVKRLIFPVVVPVHLSRVDAAKVRGSAGMPVVFGGVFGFAWYMGVYRAMTKCDVPLVASLWQMGLTTSVQARHSLKRHELAVWSIECSERIRATEGIAADTFPAFALKCLLCLPDDSTTLNEVTVANILSDLGVSFCGERANKGMVRSVLLSRAAVDQKRLALLRKIDTLDAPGAKDLFSSGYKKFARVVKLWQEASSFVGDSVTNWLYLVLGAIEFALRFEKRKRTEFPLAQLDKSRDGTPGVVPTILGRRSICKYVYSFVEDMRGNQQCSTLAQDMHKLLGDVANYAKYELAFRTPRNAFVSAQGKFKKARSRPRRTRTRTRTTTFRGATVSSGTKRSCTPRVAGRRRRSFPICFPGSTMRPSWGR